METIWSHFISGIGAFTEEHSRELAAEISDGRVEIYPLSCKNGWLRDMGPTFVISQDRKEIRGIDWAFNGWGEIVPVDEYKQDATVARNYCKAKRYKVCSSDLICEGGNLAFDGEGTVITTEAVHLDEKRNGKVKTKEEIEGILLNYLGAEKIIWIPEGVYADETKGHVDNMVAFVRPGEVVLCWTDDKSDPQYPVSVEAEQLLKNSTDAKGRTFTVHRLVSWFPSKKSHLTSL